MSTGMLMQYVVVALAVLASAVIAFRKLMPNLTNRWRAALAIRVARRHPSRLGQVTARRLQPPKATVHSCADGCATCNACGPRRPAAARPPAPDRARGGDRPATGYGSDA